LNKKQGGHGRHGRHGQVNFFGVAFFKPWRVMACNLLDCMLLFGMMVILDVGSVSVANDSPIASMVMVMVFVVIMLLSILLTLLNGGYQYFQQKYRKQFRFFTCHQKNAAGSMARFLGKGQNVGASTSNMLSGYCKDKIIIHDDSLQGLENSQADCSSSHREFQGS
jgi:hypothetical protein